MGYSLGLTHYRKPVRTNKSKPANHKHGGFFHQLRGVILSRWGQFYAYTQTASSVHFTPAEAVFL